MTAEPMQNIVQVQGTSRHWKVSRSMHKNTKARIGTQCSISKNPLSRKQQDRTHLLLLSLCAPLHPADLIRYEFPQGAVQ